MTIWLLDICCSFIIVVLFLFHWWFLARILLSYMSDSVIGLTALSHVQKLDQIAHFIIPSYSGRHLFLRTYIPRWRYHRKLRSQCIILG